ncbi:MAG: tetratricopeptide repeat protein [Acidobacteriota bacterium]
MRFWPGFLLAPGAVAVLAAALFAAPAPPPASSASDSSAPASSAPGSAGKGGEDRPDPLAALGHEVTSGAAPGYVEDRVCGLCHQDLYTSYQDVAMARSFYRPETAAAQGRLVEDFAAEPYVHEPSGRRYRIERREAGELLFRRWQVGPDGEPIHELEIPVDWILGSGNHSRVYLYRTPQGELYQLPLAWYARLGEDGAPGWAMAPGFDRPEHEGVLRRVRRECMVCHNAYPDVPAGSDAHHASQTYPAELPEGTGCQRCHGPGAEHVRRGLAPGSETGAVREAIVNPGRLDPQLRDSVCHGCHMQPSVALPGVRRFGRGDYSFRPGELLDEYRVQLDVTEEDHEASERFEINHHPYRLEQSRCFQESGGALSCLTCHDPHRKVPPEERAAHYRRACLGCHQEKAEDACPTGTDGTPHAGESGPAAPAERDCTACHMPERRPTDVIHVVMTDHKIVARPEPREARLAPLEESEPVLTELHFLRPERAPEGPEGEVYRAVGVLRTGAGGADAAAHLERNLRRAGMDDPEPWLELAQARLKLKQPAEAEAVLRRVLANDPAPGTALLAREWLAIARSGQGDRGGAITLLREVLAEDPDRPEPRFNLGRLLLAEGAGEAEDPEGARAALAEARDHFRRALELRPNQVAAWDFLGAARLALGEPEEAVEALERALALDPGRTEAYLRLAEALMALDRRKEAVRYLRHGTRFARNPEPLRERLAALP